MTAPKNPAAVALGALGALRARLRYGAIAPIGR